MTRLLCDLYRIDAAHFCAGLLVHAGVVVYAAPVLSWAVGNRWDYVAGWCERKGHTVVQLGKARR